jgi:SAM-dependent methyltransferase
MSESARQPHAVLDLPSRRLKAMKIERLLDLDSRPGPLRVLEIGVGSGGISHYFGTHPSGRYDVVGVDVVDNRLISDGYRYVAITDTSLPFADASFDVVISNHVIEHVGDKAAQAHHLSEMRRVMCDGAIGYLAVPNRWMLVEPHYRLAFLSWWPESMRSWWLRLFRRETHYDCRPLTRGDLEGRLRDAGFHYAQQHTQAMQAMVEIERGRLSKFDLLMLRIVASLATWLRSAIPTLIYTLERPGARTSPSIRSF